MKKKIFVLSVALVISLSTYLIVLSDLEVKATPGGGGSGEEDDIDLDFDFCWNVSKKIGETVYDAYKGLEIIRGREFGTIGDQWAAEKIEE